MGAGLTIITIGEPYDYKCRRKHLRSAAVLDVALSVASQLSSSSFNTKVAAGANVNTTLWPFISCKEITVNAASVPGELLIVDVSIDSRRQPWLPYTDHL